MASNNYNKSATDNSLLILQFNANGLKNHALDLETVLNNKHIDVALISETHFTKYSYIYISSYTLIKQIIPIILRIEVMSFLLNPISNFIPYSAFLNPFSNLVLLT